MADSTTDPNATEGTPRKKKDPRFAIYPDALDIIDQAIAASVGNFTRTQVINDIIRRFGHQAIAYYQVPQVNSAPPQRSPDAHLMLTQGSPGVTNGHPMPTQRPPSGHIALSNGHQAIASGHTNGANNGRSMTTQKPPAPPPVADTLDDDFLGDFG